MEIYSIIGGVLRSGDRESQRGTERGIVGILRAGLSSVSARDDKGSTRSSIRPRTDRSPEKIPFNFLSDISCDVPFELMRRVIKGTDYSFIYYVIRWRSFPNSNPNDLRPLFRIGRGLSLLGAVPPTR